MIGTVAEGKTNASIENAQRTDSINVTFEHRFNYSTCQSIYRHTRRDPFSFSHWSLIRNIIQPAPIRFIMSKSQKASTLGSLAPGRR